MARQMEMVEKQHECPEPHTLTGSTTHITQHLEPFIAASITGECAFGNMTMWLQDDGASAHIHINVCRHLNNIFSRQWIGHRGLGLAAWPARSPDLNLLDFYLWGYLKSIVYGEPVPDVQTLQQHVHIDCEAIRTKPKTFKRVRQSIMSRVHCIP